MWTVIMQSLNKKEWKLLELQITQTRHHKSVADGQSGPTSSTAFAKATQVKMLLKLDAINIENIYDYIWSFVRYL